MGMRKVRGSFCKPGPDMSLVGIGYERGVPAYIDSATEHDAYRNMKEQRKRIAEKKREENALKKKHNNKKGRQR